MDGPGRYVSDPTEGMVNVNDLLAPQRKGYCRDFKQTPCPRCGQLASRIKAMRTLHDVAV